MNTFYWDQIDIMALKINYAHESKHKSSSIKKRIIKQVSYFGPLILLKQFFFYLCISFIFFYLCFYHCL